VYCFVSDDKRMPETRVLIVDDHPFMRRDLAQTIEDQPNLTVCGEAASVTEVLQKIDSARPHLAVVDISPGDRRHRTRPRNTTEMARNQGAGVVNA
jgi:DNA-binding NarL/FixJ family response regulator